MKRLTQLFQFLLGAVSICIKTFIAAGRLAWRTIRNWWKKRSKWFHRSIAAVLILIPTGFMALVGYLVYNDLYGRDYWDRRISDNVTLRSFSDNKWRLYDHQADEYTTQKINWLSETSDNDSLAVYALPGKRGYINVNTGHIIIDAQENDYRKAWVFSEGLAAVMKDGKIGFINDRNEVVIPFRFDYTLECRMYDLGYVFHDGFCVMTDADGNLGLIDKNGNWVVESSYDEIWAPHESGYRMIIKDGRYGVLDSTAAILYPAEYRYIGIDSDGFVLIKDGKQWQVDFLGNVVQPFIFDNTSYLGYPVGYNECGETQYAFADYMKYEVMDRYGIMNRITGEPITPAIYSEINMLSNDLFEVQEYDRYEWYLLDTNGNVVHYE